MTGTTAKPSESYSRLIFFSHQILFSLTLSLAATSFVLVPIYSWAFRDSNSQNASRAFTFWYFFLRTAVRWNSFLGLNPKAPTGATITLLSIVLVIGLALFAILSRFSNTRPFRLLLEKAAGLMILSVFPAYVLLVSHYESLQGSLPKLGYILLLLIFVLLTLASLGLYLTVKRNYPLRPAIILITANFAFLTWIRYGRFSWMVLRNVTPFDSLNILLLIISAFAALAWVFYARLARKEPLPEFSKPWKLALLVCVPWFLFSLLPWLQPNHHKIADAKYLDSVRITMKRGQCFGRCPVYTILLDGSGATQFFGERNVRTKGPISARITKQQILNLLESVDREHFLSMEDNAFANCYDTPYTTITIAVDGFSKTVTGDDCYWGSWPKSGLYKIAEQIDETVGSEEWIKCHGSDCVSH